MSREVCYQQFLPYTSSVSSMIHQLGWQQLETHDRRHNSRLCLPFKINHNLTCIPLSSRNTVKYKILKIS